MFFWIGFGKGLKENMWFFRLFGFVGVGQKVVVVVELISASIASFTRKARHVFRLRRRSQGRTRRPPRGALIRPFGSLSEGLVACLQWVVRGRSLGLQAELPSSGCFFFSSSLWACEVMVSPEGKVFYHRKDAEKFYGKDAWETIEKL